MIERIDAFDKVKDVDLIFTDWNMPNMSGLDLLDIIKKLILILLELFYLGFFRYQHYYQR